MMVYAESHIFFLNEVFQTLLTNVLQVITSYKVVHDFVSLDVGNYCHAR